MAYIVDVPRGKMKRVSDMLRYDGCFQVEDTGDNYRCHLLNFTRDRWASFGFVPPIAATIRLSAPVGKAYSLRARGFTEGIRFAQKLLGQRLIEGYPLEGYPLCSEAPGPAPDRGVEG